MKIVYLPTETQTRELDSNIILGLYLIQKHDVDHVIIGDKRLLSLLARLHFLPVGVYHMKSAQSFLLPFIKRLYAQGFRFTVQNAESIVTFDNENRTDTFMTPPETIDYLERVFCSNRDEHQMLSKLYGDELQAKFVLSGFLRLQGSISDLGRFYKPEIDAIKTKCGKFILYNSTAGIMYHAMKDMDLKAMRALLVTQGVMEDHADVLIEWSIQSQATFFSFLEFTRLFKNKHEYQDVKIVFRPHPSENFDFFKMTFGNDTRIIVDRSYSVMPWILASELVIGSTSTTLVESSALNKPTLSFLPSVNLPVMDVLLKNVSNQCGKISSTPLELLEDVSNILSANSKNGFCNHLLAVSLLGKKHNAYEEFSTHFSQIANSIHQLDFFAKIKLGLLKSFCLLASFALHINGLRFSKNALSSYAVFKFRSGIDIEGYQSREYPEHLNASRVVWKKNHDKCIQLSRK